MNGYSFFVVLIFLLGVVSPRQMANIQRLFLSTDRIVADKTSPAFSAMEDAVIIRELLDYKRPKKERKINLKGIKLSLNQRPFKLEKVDLRGERIEVAHFTNKFIVNKGIELGLSGSITKNSFVEKKFKIKPSQVKTHSLASSMSGAVGLLKGVNLKKFSASNSSAKVLKDERPVLKKAVVVNHTPKTIAGNIFLKDGGDFFGDGFYYYMNRSLDGRIYESGVVNGDQNAFKMEISEVKGVLSVELRSEQGDVLAYGEEILSGRGKDLQNLNIQIFPSQNLFTGRVLSSSESIGGEEQPLLLSEKKIEGVLGVLQVDKKGYFNQEIFEKGSSFIVETKSKNYWSDLNFGVAGRPLYPRLIRKGVFADFAKTLDPFGEDIEIYSAIVGSITQKGLAQEGIKIILFKNEYQRPIYFNSKGSANSSLVKTSRNGGFIFINIPEGEYLVQAIRGSKVVAQKWYLVREGRISQGQLNIKSNPVLIASAESFPGNKNEENFTLHEIGVDQSFILKSNSEIQVKTLTNPELLSLRMEKLKGYADHIYLTSVKARKKRFKVVENQWLNRFLNNKRSNANRAMGFVIGFIEQNDFKVVRETTTVLSSESQIFYFDKYGDATQSGLVGGGFIITDVLKGFKSVVVSIKGKDTFLNKVVMSKPYSIAIF